MNSPLRVVVIGGGVTGVGVARDLVMRGVDVTLLERDRLAAGTTGRMHGLLHSGARYAVSDPESARQCREENDVLRKIASHCVEATGGLFVQLAGDDPAYFDRKREACNAVGIRTRTASGSEARELEPSLSTDVERALLVPDAAIDPFRLVAATAASAEAHGATIETGYEVVDLERSDGGLTAVRATTKGETDDNTATTDGPDAIFEADHVVNAAGPWVGDVVSGSDIEIPISPSKGAMVVTNSRPVDTVINRCRPKTAGDILVPHETTAILGTTDVPIDDPDSVEETPEEIAFLRDELSEMVPVLSESRIVRAYWGVRPLFDPGAGAGSPTDTSRDFAVLDHETRDGVAGLTTVLGGKLTTYRLMAERVADLVAEKLGVETPCRTARKPLPGSEADVDPDAVVDRYDLRTQIADRTVDRLGTRTDSVLESSAPNPIECECEGVTRAEVRDAIDSVGADLAAVRMRTRATMGTCQGGFCSHRLAVLLAEEYDIETAWKEFVALLEERWRGQRLVSGGDHLAQMALNRAVRRESLDSREGIRGDGTIQFEQFDGGDPK
ncbi:MAG: anaerobic glycerol-3-phosphate dehydrogenase subunit GlpA [Halodesulfurarchaeum sp.]